MGIAAHIARLRAVVGHELLLLPSVTVLPVDSAGRISLNGFARAVLRSIRAEALLCANLVCVIR